MAKFWVRQNGHVQSHADPTRTTNQSPVNMVHGQTTTAPGHRRPPSFLINGKYSNTNASNYPCSYYPRDPNQQHGSKHPDISEVSTFSKCVSPHPSGSHNFQNGSIHHHLIFGEASCVSTLFLHKENKFNLNLHVALVHGVLCDVLLCATALHDDHGDPQHISIPT